MKPTMVDIEKIGDKLEKFTRDTDDILSRAAQLATNLKTANDSLGDGALSANDYNSIAEALGPEMNRLITMMLNSSSLLNDFIGNFTNELKNFGELDRATKIQKLMGDSIMNLTAVYDNLQTNIEQGNKPEEPQRIVKKSIDIVAGIKNVFAKAKSFLSDLRDKIAPKLDKEKTENKAGDADIFKL